MTKPSEFSAEIMDIICERMGEGQTLRQICKDPELPERSTIYRWLDAHKEFREKYARAREALMDYYADEIIEVAWDTSNDTIQGTKGQPLCNHEWIARSRLKSDNMKFLMGKLHPGRYGDKLTPEAKAIELQTFRFAEAREVTGITRSIIDPPNPLKERIKELETLLGVREREAVPPRLLTHDPGPLPSWMDGEIGRRMVRLIRDYTDMNDQREPQAVFDEVMDVCKRALIAKYGPGMPLPPLNGTTTRARG